MRVTKQVLSPGDGTTFPTPGQSVTLHYVGRLASGEEFDSSHKRGQPLQVQIGAGQVIRGWDEAVPQMSLGEKAILHICADYGYGAQGAGGVIPPNSDLVFEVELLAIGEPGGSQAGKANPSPALCEPGLQIQVGPGVSNRHTATVLLMHGLGDTAAGWQEPCQWLAQRLPHVRFVLPTAPTSPALGCPSWFDIHGEGRKHTFDASMASLGALLDSEASVVGPERVVVAGFSQGGVLAYHLGLLQCRERPVAGVLALSTFLSGPSKSSTLEFPAATATTPVLICHGTEDDRIPGGVEWAKGAQKSLQERGCGDVELKLYEGMGHAVSMEELRDVLVWLRRVLPAATDAQSKL